MLRIYLAVFTVVPLMGQEAPPPTIRGEIRTSVGDMQPMSRVLLNRTIKSSKVIHDQGRTITIHNVDPPAPVERIQGEKPSVKKSSLTPQIETKASVGFTFSATALSDHLTRLEWWSHSAGQSNKHISWSNISWATLQGFNAIEDDKRSYAFILFLNSSSLEEFNKQAEAIASNRAPDVLSDFSQSGAAYTNEDDGKISEVGKAFMESIHTLYDLKEPELRQAQELRQDNQEKYRRELELNPPKKEDVVIQFWERLPATETSTQEGK